MTKAKSLLGAAVLLLCTPLMTFSQEAQSGEESAVRQVVQDYIKGVTNHDAESIRRALHPKGREFFRTDANDLGESRQGRAYNVIRDDARRGVPAVRAVPRIVAVDVTGDAASVKLEIDYPDSHLGGQNVDLRTPPPGVRRTDYLTLLRLAEGWRIVSKVSTLGRLPASAQSAQR
jgi:Putative lumazine-binding